MMRVLNILCYLGCMAFYFHVTYGYFGSINSLFVTTVVYSYYLTRIFMKGNTVISNK